MRKIILTLSICASFFLGACNTYHTDTNLGFKSTAIGTSPYAVEIIREPLPAGSYASLGIVSGRVNKTTIFDKDPTKEQADEVLKLKASRLGANALINVQYEVGLFGLIQATGEAIQKK